MELSAPNPWKRFWRSIFRVGLPKSEQEAERLSRYNLLMHLHPSRIKPEHLNLKHTWCMGGISALLFMLSVISGIVLMLYYKPNIADAHASIRDIDNVVAFGAFWRSFHRYSSELMLVTVFLHMLRVVLNRAYRPPREFNWAVGITLLLLVLLTAFTGYLLPFDVLSYDAVSVAKGMASNAPVVGKFIINLLFGGEYIGDEALLRFYVLHCLILPLSIVILLAIHFWRVRKDGYKGGL